MSLYCSPLCPYISSRYMKALQISQTDRVSAGIKIGSLTQKHLFCVDIYRPIKGYSSFAISFYKYICAMRW